MRGIWQLAIASAVVGAVLVVSGFLLLESGGSNKSSKPQTKAPAPNVSYGNANISAQAPPKGDQYNRTVVVRVKSKTSGAPLRDAKVIIHGEMTTPHAMTLYNKNLHEVGRGEYKGPYTLVMPGDWRVVIVVTSKKGDTSTSALPVRVTG